MSLGLLLVVWLPPILPVWRRAAYLALHEVAYGTPDGFDRGAAIVFGLIAGCLWFVVVPIAIAKGDRFFLPPREKRAEAANARLQARIRELEREVGIR